jgi:hypothetical protein
MTHTRSSNRGLSPVDIVEIRKQLNDDEIDIVSITNTKI